MCGSAVAVHGLGGHEVLHFPVSVEEVVAVAASQHIVVVRGAAGVDGRQDGLDPRIGDGAGRQPRVEVGVIGESMDLSASVGTLPR